MKVILGLNLDKKRSWKRQDAFDRLMLGPSGLLSQLELYLGLSGKRQSRLQRTLVCRKVLKRVDDGNRFYSRSMLIDDFGVADRLLEWRDDLYLHGWKGFFSLEGHSKRLLDLADIEHGLKNEGLSPGNGERLILVAAALQDMQTPITSLVLLEPLDRHPLCWQEVIRQLPFRYSSSFERPLAVPGTHLYELQRRLLEHVGPACPDAAVDDGSVTVLTAATPLAAAYRSVRDLADLPGDTLLVHPVEPSLLDEVLVSEGMAQQGFSTRKNGGPVFQLLPLATRLLQEPLDVDALFSFLALPEKVNPLDPALAEELARTVARSPGTGSPEWNKVLEQFKINDGGSGRNAVEEIQRWLGASHSPASPIPLDQLIQCAGRVSDFLDSKKVDSDERDGNAAVWSAALDQASAFRDALSMLRADGERHAGRYQIEKLLEMADSGTVPYRRREAGSISDTSSPGAVCEPFSHVLWWWAAEPQMEQGPPWTAAERSLLEREGVMIPSLETLLRWQSEDWRRPVLAAEKKLTLVLPPETEEHHPFWLELSRYVPGAGIRQVEGIISGSDGTGKTLPVLDLPRRKQFWSLPERVTIAQCHFSPTSLEAFIAAPSCWFLDQVARIRQPQFIGMSDGIRLYGLLAHRIVQELVAMLQEKNLGAIEFDAWFNEVFPVLVRHEGALLLLPGRGADLENLRSTVRRAVARLLPVLVERGGQRMEAETELQGSVEGVVMRGRADLLLADRDGQLTVIDLKWGGTETRRNSLKEGTHLQLLAYAAMVAGRVGAWPGLAYYVIGRSRLIADRKGIFPQAEVVVPGNGESAELLWQRVLDSFSWRKTLLEKGIVPVAGDGIDEHEDVAPPEGVIGFRTGEDPCNPYRFLEGWEVYL